jgi:gas vesicle protein
MTRDPRTKVELLAELEKAKQEMVAAVEKADVMELRANLGNHHQEIGKQLLERVKNLEKDNEDLTKRLTSAITELKKASADRDCYFLRWQIEGDAHEKTRERLEARVTNDAFELVARQHPVPALPF